MFTPPPSPGRPSKSAADRQSNEVASPIADRPLSPTSLKRRIGRRTKWTVALVPMALVLITASTRYLTHPAAFHMFSEPATLNLEALSKTAADWTPHKRHLLPELRDVSASSPSNSAPSAGGSASSQGPTGSGSSTAAPATTTLPPDQQIVPTVPGSTPTLPNPFPQAFDSGLSQNFSSLSCFNFFSNMTNTTPFRSCRPFSLLLQASNAFIAAQNDLDTLNSIVWGTCNTDFDATQCSENMAWFSQSLVSNCAIDLKDGNSMAVNTQIALNAFDLMRSAGCLIDPTTNTYCYLDAVHNSNPSDTYFYSLPLGVTVPNNTIASCSACTKSLMTLYYGGLDNSSTASELPSLQGTYPNAAKIAVADCGSTYATLLAGTSGAAGALRAPWLLVSSTLFVGLASTFLWLS